MAAAWAAGSPIWLWRAGRWSRLPSTLEAERPAASGLTASGYRAQEGSAGDMDLALPDSKSLWCRQSSGRLLRYWLVAEKRGEAAADEHLQKLIAALAADAFEVRERASSNWRPRARPSVRSSRRPWKPRATWNNRRG